MKLGRIENAVVVEIIAMPSEGTYHPDFLDMFELVPDGVEAGWLWDGEVFAPPPEPAQPDIAAAREAAYAQVIASVDRLTGRITSRYPRAEVDSWPVKEAEARAIAAGGDDGDASLLSAIAGARQVALADLAATVVQHADLYHQIVAAMEAVRVTAEAALAAATTLAEVNAALASAQVSIETKAAELGVGQ